MEQRARILDTGRRIERLEIEKVVETARLGLTRDRDDFDGGFVAQNTRVG